LDQPHKTPAARIRADDAFKRHLRACPPCRTAAGALRDFEVQTDFELPDMGVPVPFDTHLMLALRFKQDLKPHAGNLGQVIQSSKNSGYPIENIAISNRESRYLKLQPRP
jgi:hypothetical protein